MGNCCIRKCSASWVDDDEDEEERGWSEDQVPGCRLNVKEQEDRGMKERMLLDYGSTDQVKIKISKKRLQELLKEVNGKGSSIKQVMDQLMRENDALCGDHEPWSPVLQSIPELPE